MGLQGLTRHFVTPLEREPAVWTTAIRRGLISCFIIFHLTALAWWNFGRTSYATTEENDEFQLAILAVADQIDASSAVRSVLKGYIRSSGLWQVWILFGPDAPHYTGRVEIHGIESFDSAGRPVLDPTPIWTDSAPTLTERTRMIGAPPCGWDATASPAERFLREQFARYKGRLADPEAKYEGLQMTCARWALPSSPGEPIGAPGFEVLWAGPLRPTRGER
jgi:hypothetical protein